MIADTLSVNQPEMNSWVSTQQAIARTLPLPRGAAEAMKQKGEAGQWLNQLHVALNNGKQLLEGMQNAAGGAGGDALVSSA